MLLQTWLDAMEFVMLKEKRCDSDMVVIKSILFLGERLLHNDTQLKVICGFQIGKYFVLKSKKIGK